MNLDHDFFQVSKLSEDQKMQHFSSQIQVNTKKKDLHHKWNTFFPNSSVDLPSDAHQSQIIGDGDADQNHTQIIGGDTVELSPPSHPGFGTHDSRLFARPRCLEGT